MEITLQEEVLEGLSSKAVLAYVAICRRGAGTWSTAHLACCVGCRSEQMRDGLEELSERHPEAVFSVKPGKWMIGGDKRVVQNLDSVDDRRVLFLDDLKLIWEWANKQQKFTMNAADGNAIRIFLRKHKDWDREMWRVALRSRFMSEVNKAESVYRWVNRLPEYLNSPLDRYGKPMIGGVGGALGKSIEREQNNHLAVQEVVNGNY